MRPKRKYEVTVGNWVILLGRAAPIEYERRYTVWAHTRGEAAKAVTDAGIGPIRSVRQLVTERN